MTRKLLVPKAISKLVGGLGLSRQIVIDLFARLHADAVGDYDEFRRFRSEDERCFRYAITIKDESGRKHSFTLTIDDTTSDEHLIIVGVRHQRRP